MDAPVITSELIVARHVALSLLNKPYLWGGDNPMVGLDCSGLVIEILKSVGKLSDKGDWTAQGLWDIFKDNEIEQRHTCEGCLIFWKNRHGIANHVEYAVSDNLSLGARGAGSTITSVKIAYEKDAYIKIRPWKNRPGKIIKGVLNPFL